MRRPASIALCIWFVVVQTVVARADEKGASFVRVEVSQGTNFSTAASPRDGTIAFDLQGQLWIVAAKGGKATAITDPLTDPMDEARLPAWSPDGQWIAFQGFTDSNFHVWIIRPDGSGLRQITFGPFDDREPYWSPEGKRLVFASDRRGTYDLWSVRVDGGEPEQMVSSDAEEFFPSWSPDGRRVAFVRNATRGTWEICVREEGGQVRCVTSSTDELSAPSWSKDGRELWYSSNGLDAFYGGGSRLWRVGAAGGQATAVTHQQEDVFPSRVSWLGSGAFQFPSDGQIWMREASGRKQRAIPFSAEFNVAAPRSYPRKNHRFTSKENRAALGVLRPAVSPDGRAVAFTGLGDLWLAERGKAPRRLTDDPYLDVDAAWSRDGKRLAYVSDRRGSGSMDLYVRDLSSGADSRVVTSEEDLMSPSWSPDGRTIAVVSRNSADWHAGQLQLVNVATGAMRSLGEAQFLPSQPSWSADGRTIAMTVLKPSSNRGEAGHNQFLLVSAEDGKARLATPVPNHSLGSRTYYGASWSPDGRTIAYVYAGLLWMVPVDPAGHPAGPPRRLTSEWSASPSWTGDSRAIVYQSLDGLRKLHLDDASVETIPLDLEWQRAVPVERKIVRAGRLFDGASDRYRRDMDIVIDGNVITDIVPRRASWPDAKIIDASNRTVIPGLFQMHVHHFVSDGEKDGRNWLAYGITSVREPGADPYEALERRESWASGRRVGPRLFYAGILEGGRVYYWMNEPIVTEAQVELELERIARHDYDFVKTYERLSHRIQKRVVQFAHAQGIPVASHEIYPAAMYGHDVVEHLGTTDRMFSSDRISYARIAYDDVVQLMAKSGMAMVPTLGGRAPNPAFLYEAERHPAALSTRQFRAFPARHQRSAAYLLDYQKKRFRAALDYVPNEQRTLRRLADAGVRLATGTDGGTNCHGYNVALEIDYLAAAGLGNAKALRAATIESARVTGVDDHLGSIERGKLADMVILDGDPLARITDLHNVTAVLADGRVHDIESLLIAPRAAATKGVE